MSHQRTVLSLYRQILRMSREWQSLSGNMQDTQEERKYIFDEACTLFRENKNVTNPTEIAEHVREAETRIALALHYRIPYPRQIHLQQSSLPPSKKGIKSFKKSQKKAAEESQPIYMKSYGEKNFENR
ncbi:LYR motif-containing protein 1 isoform X1 [Octopus bimaculoides]|uniref:LYR motif-containing protein 1 isoform X1 n=1 Tax=Octopus bimaculoides TaxID=37653 RepID=UPI0022E42938|nr:LYR motif-containing protein 1 isoform X1 [Octopus bimaculoides]XP_052827158.1 LYR motif-containing protein 1 isoform X1 [Octopus bimaculoides]XP_052827161.1 LYR motif-containing protein 1 isoform X1 [Octopus bimaculoides]XP_052827162.1 LYR motif-containing protein 1 isoform X1 [Octopus bimaculoides]